MTFSEDTNRIENQDEATVLHGLVHKQGGSIEFPYAGHQMIVIAKHSERRGDTLLVDEGERSIQVRRGPKSPWQFDGATGWNTRRWTGGPTRTQVDRTIHEAKVSTKAALRKP